MQSHGNESHDFYMNEVEDLKTPQQHFDETTEPQLGFKKRSEADQIKDLAKGLTLTDIEEARTVHNVDTTVARTPLPQIAPQD